MLKRVFTYGHATQEALTIRQAVGPLVHGDWVKNWVEKRFRYFLCMFVCGLGVGVGIGVGRPCPPVHNDIVTPRHLL